MLLVLVYIPLKYSYQTVQADDTKLKMKPQILVEVSTFEQTQFSRFLMNGHMSNIITIITITITYYYTSNTGSARGRVLPPLLF